MELINKSTRRTIKNMAQVSQCARVLSLMPTSEDFGNRLIDDMVSVSRRVNNISIKINEIMDKYSSVPGEFLVADFDETLKNLDNTNDYTKNALKGVSDSLTTSVKTSKEMADNLGSAVSSKTSALLQVGGGLDYDSIAMSSNIKLSMTGDGKREVTGYIRDWTKNTTESVSDFFDNKGKGIEGINKFIDDNNDGLLNKVENSKDEIEDKIRRVRDTFEGFTKDFNKAFGFVNGQNFTDDNKNIDKSEPKNSENTGDVVNFIKNFNIGKVVTSIGGIVVGAGSATMAIDLLPTIDVDRMLKKVIGGVDNKLVSKITELQSNKKYDNEPDLLDVPDTPYKLSKDDLEKYNSNEYDKYLEDFVEENDKARKAIFEKMQKVRTCSDLIAVGKENEDYTKGNKSALNSIRNLRLSAVKATQIEKNKGFLNIELNYLKNECLNIKDNIKNDWDSMLSQYKMATKEIKNFFTVDGFGGSETIDRCCDKINEDSNQIVELCKSIAIEMTNASCMIGVPYSVGFCCDMPVHKILAFVKDLQIILTFIKNLIRLGMDIILQLSILAKLIFNGLQNLEDLLKKLKKLIGADRVLNMIDDLVVQIRPKMIEGKLLMENALSPIYYNETEDYERRIEAIEGLLSDDVNGGYVEKFRYTDDVNARQKYKNKVFGGYKNEDDIEDVLEELESKGEREIVAYRSPLLNDSGDDFVGWIFYYADAYDDMNRSWSSRKKRKRNRVIKNASKKNKLRGGKLSGGVAELRRNNSFGKYVNGKYKKNSVDGFSAYYWYTKYTNDPMDCDPDFDNIVFTYDEDGNIISQTAKNKQVVSAIQTTANGSLVELSDGRRVFVEGKIVKSGDFVNVEGVKYKVK